MIKIKEDYIYSILFDIQTYNKFIIIFLSKTLDEEIKEEDLMTIFGGPIVNCYGRDIKKAKKMLLDNYEKNLKEQITLVDSIRKTEKLL